MLISVIVCTFNRCDLLGKALDSIAASRIPSAVEWEILVVDNNSTDETQNVIRDFCRRFPHRFRSVFETAQGLSSARNAGIRESRGAVVVFTDDDVVVEPDWLWNLTADIAAGEWAGTGGRIIPVWGSKIPRWLDTDDPSVSGPFVALDLGPVPVQLTEAPVGANMAFRRDVFEKYGLFRTDLGRRGNSLLSCEDSEFGDRLLAGGEKLRYEPAAVVYHPVPENRLTKQYLLSWSYWNGRSDVVLSGIPKQAKWFIAGVPLYLFRRLARWSVEWLLSVRPSKRFTRRLIVWSIAGSISECHRSSRIDGSSNHIAVRTEPSIKTE